MAEIIAVVNQKGGVSKTTTVACLGSGLASRGKKVLLIDLDAQGSLSICMGCDYPDRHPVTMAEIFRMLIEDTEGSVNAAGGIFSCSEGLFYVPSCQRMSSVEFLMSRTERPEALLKRFLSVYGNDYDYILLDCPPMLGLITMNALTAASKVLIPVQAEYLAVKGLEQLLGTIARVRKRINPSLEVLGILPSMVDFRTRDARKVMKLLEDTYGKSLRILPGIPFSVRVKEISSGQRNIYACDRNGKAARAYEVLTDIVLAATGNEVIPDDADAF